MLYCVSITDFKIWERTMHYRSITCALTAFIVTVMVAGMVTPADAGWRQDRHYEIENGHTTAHSRFGNGSVSGAVRPTRKGPQVQLPNGRWTYCRTSCSETLRVQTVDLDEYHNKLVGRGTIQNECGIFGCLDIGW